MGIGGTHHLSFEPDSFTCLRFGLLRLFLIIDDDVAILVHDQRIAVLVSDKTKILKADRSGLTCRNHRFLATAGRNSADVERSHGQLRSGLTDRLCRDDTESIAKFRILVRGKILAVAFDTDSVFNVTGQD